MTLQNGCITGPSAYLWTDTLYWNGETGEPIGFDTKAFQLQTWPAAGVLSVSGGNPHEMAFAIGNAWPLNVEALLAETVKAVRTYCRSGGFARVLLATNLHGPRLHMIASDGAASGEPFEPFELLSFTSSGNQSAAYHLAVGAGFTPERMAKVIDAQIAEPFEGVGVLERLGKQNWIGGNIIEIEVKATGVESRVVRALQPLAG
jgi:hypothetical protein